MRDSVSEGPSQAGTALLDVGACRLDAAKRWARGSGWVGG